MKKTSVLVVMDRFDVAASANSLCVMNIIDECQRLNLGIDFYVLTSKLGLRRSRYSNASIKSLTYVFNLVYYWYFWGHAFKSKYAVVNRLFQRFRRLVRAPLRLLFPEITDAFNSRALLKTAEMLITTHGITNLLTVSLPFSTQRIGSELKRRLPSLNWTVYELDPFVSNYTFDAATWSERLSEENAVYAGANQIISTPQIVAENKRRGFVLTYGAKVHTVPLPNLDLSKNLRTDLAATNRGLSQSVSLVYCGRFYPDIRNPREILDVLNKLSDPSFIFHYYGEGCEEQFKGSQHGHGQLQMHGHVSDDVCQSAMAAADVLVNVGNDVDNQLPSKVFAYLATGKPILSIMTRTDPSRDLLESYPLAFILYKDDYPFAAPLLAEVASFLRSAAGKHVPTEALAAIYADYTVTSVVRSIADYAGWLA